MSTAWSWLLGLPAVVIGLVVSHRQHQRGQRCWLPSCSIRRTPPRPPK